MNDDYPRLIIDHTNGAQTEIVFNDNGGPVCWTRTETGILVKHDWKGHRTTYPWATIQSYTILPRSFAGGDI